MWPGVSKLFGYPTFHPMPTNASQSSESHQKMATKVESLRVSIFLPYELTSPALCHTAIRRKGDILISQHCQDESHTHKPTCVRKTARLARGSGSGVPSGSVALGATE